MLHTHKFILKVTFMLLNINAILCTNNVCPTWLDYWIPFNPRCTYNDDQDLELPEISKKYGFPLEIYNVTTEDGYISQLFRIKSDGKSVVLIPGIFQGAMGWFTTGNSSLSIVLARQGYDVWVVSLRGTRYGNQHETLTIQDKEYWDYGLHELGTKDIPAFVETIYDLNGNRKMILLGFSMGTSACLIYCSTSASDSQKYLERVVNMAPIAHLNNITSVLGKLQNLWDPVKLLLSSANVYSLFQPSQISKAFVKLAFLQTPVNMEIYKFLMGNIFGFDYSQFSPLTLPVTVVQGSDAICVNVVENYVQIMRSGVFKGLDFNSELENTKHYRSSVAPVYNLKNILVNFTLISAENDAISTPSNVQWLFEELPPNQKCLFKIPYLNFNHQDFVTAKDVYALFYKQLVEEWLETKC